jgi:hypothetical protein
MLVLLQYSFGLFPGQHPQHFRPAEVGKTPDNLAPCEQVEALQPFLSRAISGSDQEAILTGRSVS